MLEQVDLSSGLDGAEYDRRMSALKLKIYDIGHAIFSSHTPVAIVFEGWRAAGQGRAIAELTSRLDPRGFFVYPIDAPNECERDYPWLARFWDKTPARGRISIFDGSWYRRVWLDRAMRHVDKGERDAALEDICEFERACTDDGVVMIKFFFHIDAAEQRRRIIRLLKNPETAWRVGERLQLEQDKRKRFVKAAEVMLARTEAEYAPWTIIPSTDQRWANAHVFETVIARLEPVVALHEAPLPEGINRELERIGTVDRLVLLSPEQAGRHGEMDPDA